MTKKEEVTLADDIAALRDFADTATFNYVDVSAAEKHRQALARWPLMAELDAYDSRRRLLASSPGSGFDETS